MAANVLSRQCHISYTDSHSLFLTPGMARHNCGPNVDSGSNRVITLSEIISLSAGVILIYVLCVCIYRVIQEESALLWEKIV
jgi:hypothetical protein